VTVMRPGVQVQPGAQLRPEAGSWRVDPARSHASFAARAAERQVRGRLPLTGRVLIAEPIEGSTAWLAARAGQVSTGSHMLDRQLAGPSFLDAGAFPEISFRSELLAWVPRPGGGRSAVCGSGAPSMNWPASSIWTVTVSRPMTCRGSVSPAAGSLTRGG
jgi:hypothetical protein